MSVFFYGQHQIKNGCMLFTSECEAPVIRVSPKIRNGREDMDLSHLCGLKDDLYVDCDSNDITLRRGFNGKTYIMIPLMHGKSNQLPFLRERIVVPMKQSSFLECAYVRHSVKNGDRRFDYCIMEAELWATFALITLDGKYTFFRVEPNKIRMGRAEHRILTGREMATFILNMNKEAMEAFGDLENFSLDDWRDAIPRRYD